MPFEVQYWRDSNLALSTSDEEFRAGIMLAWASWHQIPAASLPNNDIILMAMSGMGRKAPIEDWVRIKSAVLQDWVLCTDDRYYHPRIAQRALNAWAGRTKFRRDNADGVSLNPTTQRVRRLRHEHKTLRGALRRFYHIKLAHDAAIDLVRDSLNKARAGNPVVAAEEISWTDEAMAGLENSAPETEIGTVTVTLETPETVTRYSSVSAAPEIGITGQQVKGIDKVKDIAIQELQQPLRQNGSNGVLGEAQSGEGLPNSHPSSEMPTGTNENAGSDQELFLFPPSPVAVPAKSREPGCPVEKLVQLYEANMPQNPRVRHVTNKRNRIIKSGWQEGAKISAKPFDCYRSVGEGLEAWEVFFQICAESPFLTGKAPPRSEGSPPFVADIDFLMKPENIVKCLENKYHR